MHKTLHNWLNILILAILTLGISVPSAQATCNWHGRNPSYGSADSCYTNGSNTIVAYVNFNYSGKSCFKYVWSVNNSTVSGANNYYLQYQVTQNGTYNLCLKVTDTCNKCDTTICFTKVVTCIKNKCAWYKRGISFSGSDSCKGYNGISSVNALVSVQSKCYKYQWTVNGSAVNNSSTYLHYPITKNGTYTLCVKLLDTCDKCDTSYCRTFNITCFSNSCNWKSRNPAYGSFDSCYKSNQNTITAYANFNYSGKSCFKYAWSVNNTPITGANSYYIQYNVSKNGTYNLCMKVTDTCNKCDTTICFSKTIKCLSNTCAWYKRQISYNTWDSCNGVRYKSSINGAFNTQNSCYKLQWLVNNTVVSDNKNLCYQITKNGYYTLCLKVIDTCDNCDTVFCRGFNITCFPSCNWKSRNATILGWDSCKGQGYNNTVNGYIYFNYSGSSCFKYQWKVNGVAIKGATSRPFSYPIYQNGTYNLCLTVVDTCNNCDTSYCITRTITCFGSGSKCNWMGRKPYMYGWDTCKGNGYHNNVNAYISFNYSGATCFKYQWKVNGVVVNGAKTNILHFPIYKNGSYNICALVNDTCNKCDTSFCVTKNITCFKSCNWKGRIYTINFFDSCNGYNYRNSANGYVVLNQNNNNACVKYRWKVDNTIVSNTYYFSAPINQNGYHTYCLTLTDTCMSCDTTICYTRNFQCKNLGLESLQSAQVTLYPNPAGSVINISSSDNFESVEIYDMKGQLVWSGHINAGDNSIDLSTLSKGVYTIRMRNDFETVNRKIIKE